MQTKIQSLILLASLALVPLVSAASVDVNASLPSGTYDHPISIELNVTDPTAKTFYSFKPDGYPQDAYLYTGALFLKSSTPLVFFSVISPTNESKIKQNDYILEYPSSVHFLDQDRMIEANATGVTLSLVNDGASAVNIGYWQVQSEAQLIEFSTDTMIAVGERREVTIAYTGSSVITLRSPDSEERAILVINRSAATEQQKSRTAVKTIRKTAFAQFDEAKWKPIVQKLATPESTVATGSEVSTGSAETATSAVAPVVASPTESTPSNAPVVTEPAPSDLPAASDLKVSVSETQDRSNNPLYIIMFLWLLAVVGGVRFVMTKKK